MISSVRWDGCIAIRLANLKVAVTGPERVGKSSCIRRFVQDKFVQDYLPTLGFDVSVKTLQIEGNTVVLSIWDIGGQNPEDLRKKYFLGAAGFLLVFDITNRQTFEASDQFSKEIGGVAPDAPIILVANKIDLPNHQVTIEEIRQKTKKYGTTGFSLTSAKSGDGIQGTFLLLGKALLQSPGSLL